MLGKDYADLISTAKSIPHFFVEVASKYPDQIAYRTPFYDSNDKSSIQWKSTTRATSLKRVKQIAGYLRSLGVKKGDKVTIISGTRSEWLEIDLAILCCGAVSVSAYPSLLAQEIGFILVDSNSEFVICENQEQLDKVLEVINSEVILPARDNIPESRQKFSPKSVITLEDTQSNYQVINLKDIFETNYEFVIESELNRDCIASFVYTSGTTGPSKGVIQTHGNHLSNVEQATKSGVFGLFGSMFLFLPLAHSFARLINYLGALTPVEICFCGVANKKKTVVDLVQVAAEMSSCGANVVPSVPRLFEKMKSSLESPKPGIQGILIKLTLSTAGQFWNPIYWLLSPIRKKIRKKIFGTNFSHAISGGAKLPPSITAFFKNLGINIYEGYGLTETCVATNVNLPNKWRIGSVGPAFDKVEIKISEDGEILFKGPNITSGYWNRPLATAESWDQLGWFHTGDIGHLDKDGFLYITDRKKDLIVTAGGKKIPPLKVESLLLSYSIISQSIYYGDAKPFCIALVYLSPDAKNDPNITEKLEIIRKEINSQLASFESIKKIIQLPYELTIENGMLTPTLKIKRKVVVEKFSKLIEEQYK